MKNLILLFVLFCFYEISAQNIILRNIPEKYYKVKNIKFTCDNPDFSSIFLSELKKKYTVNEPGVNPDLEVKISAILSNYTSTLRDEKKVDIELRNQNNQYAGEFHRTVKGIYRHSQFLEFKVYVDKEVYPDQKNYYRVVLGSIENKETHLGSFQILEYEDSWIAAEFAKCPLIYTTTTYKTNSDEL